MLGSRACRPRQWSFADTWKSDKLINILESGEEGQDFGPCPQLPDIGGFSSTKLQNNLQSISVKAFSLVELSHSKRNSTNLDSTWIINRSSMIIVTRSAGINGWGLYSAVEADSGSSIWPAVWLSRNSPPKQRFLGFNVDGKKAWEKKQEMERREKGEGRQQRKGGEQQQQNRRYAG